MLKGTQLKYIYYSFNESISKILRLFEYKGEEYSHLFTKILKRI